MRRVHEKHAEKATNAWYENNVPCLRTKLNLHGRRGWPDQCYWLPHAPLFIEFKADGEPPSRLQQHIHKYLIKAGYHVITCITAEEAIAAIQAQLKSRPAMAPGSIYVSSSAPSARKS